MNDVAYIVGAWAVGLGAIGIYSVRTLARGRSLSRMVPEHRRRWLTSDTDAAA